MPEEDQAQMTHDEFVSSRLNHLEHENLRLVEAALERLDSDAFGLCTRCGRAIPARRLAAVPWAECCVPCQEALVPEDRARQGHIALLYPSGHPSREEFPLPLRA